MCGHHPGCGGGLCGLLRRGDPLVGDDGPISLAAFAPSQARLPQVTSLFVALVCFGFSKSMEDINQEVEEEENLVADVAKKMAQADIVEQACPLSARVGMSPSVGGSPWLLGGAV